MNPLDYLFIEAEDWNADPLPFAAHIAPRLSFSEGALDLLERARLVELDYEEEAMPLWERNSNGFIIRGLRYLRIKALRPEALVSLRLPLAPEVEREVENLVRAEAEVIHLHADDYGRELNGGSHPRHLVEALLAVHQNLVELGLRDEVTLLFGGGIEAAEHVPKAIFCGAYGVSVDFPLQRVEIDPGLGEQRIVNLIAAWLDQLLEVLGAIGMRNLRRLLGDWPSHFLPGGEEDLPPAAKGALDRPVASGLPRG